MFCLVNSIASSKGAFMRDRGERRTLWFCLFAGLFIQFINKELDSSLQWCYLILDYP